MQVCSPWSPSREMNRTLLVELKPGEAAPAVGDDELVEYMVARACDGSLHMLTRCTPATGFVLCIAYIAFLLA